jgi:hypothetical protein
VLNRRIARITGAGSLTEWKIAMLPSNMNVEAKYTFPSGIANLLQPTLAASCLRDPSHPENTVNSIYFDSVDRFHLAEKVNSDYLKTKLRLRWYGGEQEIESDQPLTAYIEVKSKQGVLRRKERVKVQIDREAVAAGREDFASLAALSELARDCGYNFPRPVFPMIAIRYKRSRYIDLLTGARIALDHGIGYSAVNSRYFVSTGPRALTLGVLEIKSSDGDIPDSLIATQNFLNRRDSFSKYEECWQLHNNPMYRKEMRWMR